MAEIALSLGSILGSVIGGIALKFTLGPCYIAGCFQTVIASIFLFVGILRRSHIERKPYRLSQVIHKIMESPSRTINTMLLGAGHFVVSFFAPVWMALIGISGLGTGLVMGVQTAFKVFMSPVVGHLTNANKAHETIIGSILILFGWVPWVISRTHWLLIPSSMLWFSGQHFLAIGNASRWYAGKSGAHLSAREISLGIGRLITCSIAIPLLFVEPVYYFAFVCAISALAVAASFYESKKLEGRTP
jgi:hypothetical protein